MLSIRLPKKMEEELDQLSKRTERPKSYFIRKALEKYLEDLKDYTIALDRLNDKKAEYLTPEEASKYLGL